MANRESRLPLINKGVNGNLVIHRKYGDWISHLVSLYRIEVSIQMATWKEFKIFDD